MVTLGSHYERERIRGYGLRVTRIELGLPVKTFKVLQGCGLTARLTMEEGKQVVS